MTWQACVESEAACESCYLCGTMHRALIADEVTTSRAQEDIKHMPVSIGCLRTLSAAAALVVLAAVAVVTVLPPAHAADTPRRGGVLLAVIAAEPPSLDPHQEGTFANIQLVAPFYSLLLQFNPTNFPEIIGDLATEWKISPDGLTYTFKIRPGIRFHDGSPLTAADVKATYDKIVFPPAGVRSIRKNAYAAITGVEAPDEIGRAHV